MLFLTRVTYFSYFVLTDGQRMRENSNVLFLDHDRPMKKNIDAIAVLLDYARELKVIPQYCIAHPYCA